jgi:hypothetical protein
MTDIKALIPADGSESGSNVTNLIERLKLVSADGYTFAGEAADMLERQNRMLMIIPQHGDAMDTWIAVQAEIEDLKTLLGSERDKFGALETRLMGELAIEKTHHDLTKQSLTMAEGSIKEAEAELAAYKENRPSDDVVGIRIQQLERELAEARKELAEEKRKFALDITVCRKAEETWKAKYDQAVAYGKAAREVALPLFFHFAPGAYSKKTEKDREWAAICEAKAWAEAASAVDEAIAAKLAALKEKGEAFAVPEEMKTLSTWSGQIEVPGVGLYEYSFQTDGGLWHKLALRRALNEEGTV